MEITLDNIEQFSVPFEGYIPNWIFKDENDVLASKEHQDQITILSKEAAEFLWDLEMGVRILLNEKYYKTITTFNSLPADRRAIKKYLYNLGIPFSHKVFIADQPHHGFVLTWKMVIKYSHNLFWANDQIVRDRTFNWELLFHHDGIFTFGKDMIFDAAKEKEKLENALREMSERKKTNPFG